MPDASSLRTMRCPNCGAPLDFTPGQSTTRCKFCDSVIEHSSDAMTADDHAHVISGSPASPASAGTPSASAGQGKRFVIKMRNGQPVVIETDGGFGTPMQMGSTANPWQTNLGPGSVTSMPMTMARPQRSSPWGCLVGVIIAAAVVIGIGGVVFATSPQAAAFVQQVLSGDVQQAIGTAGTIGARIVINRPGTIVPGANDGPPEALMLTTQYPATSGSTSETRLVAVSTTTRKLLWQTAPLDAKLYDTPILANPAFVYILNNQKLMALKRTDGTVGWQATLADKMQTSLCDCLRLAGTRLAALTDDGTLEVFDTATGRSQWKASAKAPAPRGLYVLGQRVAFMDRDAKNNGVLRAFDLATGKETTVQPACKGSDIGPAYADWTTPLWLSPKGSEFYMIFGTFATCVQRWDAQTLKMTWSAPPPDSAAGSGGSPNGLLTLFSADTLYLSEGSTVWAFALADGQARVAVSDPDHTFLLLTTHGSDLMVTAKSQRGTTKYAIWAVNAASGQTHWTFDLGDNPPLEAGGIIDDGTPVWLAQPASDGLRVIRFQSAADNKSYKILTDTLNWDSGESAGQKSAPLNLDTIILSAPDWTIWKNDTLWMVMNYQLLAFDVAQQKMVYQWP